MKITKKCEYALRCLIYLVVNENKTLSLRTISNKLEIPFKFLSLIVIDLKKNGFIESVKGPGGGYFLSQEAPNYTFKKITEAIDGKLSNYKINFATICKQETAFISHVIKESLDFVNQATYRSMNQLTLRDLANKYVKISNVNDNFSI